MNSCISIGLPLQIDTRDWLNLSKPKRMQQNKAVVGRQTGILLLSSVVDRKIQQNNLCLSLLKCCRSQIVHGKYLLLLAVVLVKERKKGKYLELAPRIITFSETFRLAGEIFKKVVSFSEGFSTIQLHLRPRCWDDEDLPVEPFLLEFTFSCCHHAIRSRPLVARIAKHVYSLGNFGADFRTWRAKHSILRGAANKSSQKLASRRRDTAKMICRDVWLVTL